MSEKNDQTPDRLKTFRDTYATGAPSPGAWLSPQVLVTILGVAIIAGLVIVRTQGHPAPGAKIDTGHVQDPESWRRFAAYLAERHLHAPALEAYEKYLDAAPIDNAARSHVSFRMAEIAIDSEDYSAALAYLYRAEFLDPETPRKGDIDKAVALCLDKLGRNVDLRRELRRRTAAHRDNVHGEAVLAEFGDEVITDRDLELAIEQLPPAAREQFQTLDQQSELLRNMVAERLLVDRARRLRLEEDAEVQEQLDHARDAIMVRKLIRDEVEDQIQIAPGDVQQFYRAEIARFTQPATAHVRTSIAANEESARAIERIDGPVFRVSEGHVPADLEIDAGIVSALLHSAPGDRLGPVEVNGGWRIFEVVDVTPERIAAFDEVREMATRMLLEQKQQQAMQALLAETLRQQDVRIFPERIAEARQQ